MPDFILRPDWTHIDIIGDIHGCYDELCELLKQLGWITLSHGAVYHPQGRRLVFVGDLVDRGPASKQVVAFVKYHMASQHAVCVKGNHDDKFYRWAQGNKVKLRASHLVTTEQYENDEPTKLAHSEWINSLPYCGLFGNSIVVAHATPPFLDDVEIPLAETDLGKGKRSTSIYGVTDGTKTEQGFPTRLPWEHRWFHSLDVATGHIVNLETTELATAGGGISYLTDGGGVFGHTLRALRYPEREWVSVSCPSYWAR